MAVVAAVIAPVIAPGLGLCCGCRPRWGLPGGPARSAVLASGGRRRPLGRRCRQRPGVSCERIAAASAWLSGRAR